MTRCVNSEQEYTRLDRTLIELIDKMRCNNHCNVCRHYFFCQVEAPGKIKDSLKSLLDFITRAVLGRQIFQGLMLLELGFEAEV